jgi:hypothetical protein
VSTLGDYSGGLYCLALPILDLSKQTPVLQKDYKLYRTLFRYAPLIMEYIYIYIYIYIYAFYKFIYVFVLFPKEIIYVRVSMCFSDCLYDCRVNCHRI